MELSIRREKKLISGLERNLAAYHQSLELLEQMERKQKGKSSADAMEEEETQKPRPSLPNARFLPPDEVPQYLVQEYGSKLAHLFVHVKHLCEDEENRIIIFSQWDRMLGQISTHFPRPSRIAFDYCLLKQSDSLLEENGIATVSCRGMFLCCAPPCIRLTPHARR